MPANHQSLSIEPLAHRLYHGSVSSDKSRHSIRHAATQGAVQKVKPNHTAAGAPDDLREPEHRLLLHVAARPVRENDYQAPLAFIRDNRHFASGYWHGPLHRTS